MGILSFGYTKSRQVDVIFNIRPIVFLLFLCDDTIVLGICKNKLSRNRNEGTLVGISLGFLLAMILHAHSLIQNMWLRRTFRTSEM